jgi:probable phosphoglycerate mutase
MPRILLIRHASHDLLGRELVGRRSGVTLSRAGSAEAEALAERLARHAISLVFASPRERAMGTAKPIAERHGLEVQIAPELDEVDFGMWTGLSFTELDQDPLWHRFNRKRAITRIPGGESMAEVAARMTGFLRNLTARQGDGDIAIIGHGDPLRVAVASLLGLPIEAMLRLEIAPASISIIRMEGQEPRLELLNDRGHCDWAFSVSFSTARILSETITRPVTQ